MRHIPMTILTLSDFNLAPQITLGRNEHHRLTVLALAGTGHSPDEADSLLHELERADLVADERVPRDIVRMGSVVFYRTTSGDRRSVELAFPKDADIGAGRISIMTPVGIALIGLRVGQSITWLTRDGRKEVLTVLGVIQPPDGNAPPPFAA
jgi:regulator of nucleoside diphosphate kinase